MWTYETLFTCLDHALKKSRAVVRRFSLLALENVGIALDKLVFEYKTLKISRVSFIRPLASKGKVLAKNGSSLAAAYIPYVWNSKLFYMRVPTMDRTRQPTTRIIAVDLAYTFADASLPPTPLYPIIGMKNVFDALAGPLQDFHGQKLTVADLINFARRRAINSGPLINHAERTIRNSTGSNEVKRELTISLMKAVGGICKITLNVGDYLDKAFE